MQAIFRSMMNEKATLQRDVLVRTLVDVLNDLAEELMNLPSECKKCPVMNVLSTFAAKLRKVGLHEEAEIVRTVREKYNI